MKVEFPISLCSLLAPATLGSSCNKMEEETASLEQVTVDAAVSAFDRIFNVANRARMESYTYSYRVHRTRTCLLLQGGCFVGLEIDIQVRYLLRFLVSKIFFSPEILPFISMGMHTFSFCSIHSIWWKFDVGFSIAVEIWTLSYNIKCIMSRILCANKSPTIVWKWFLKSACCEFANWSILTRGALFLKHLARKLYKKTHRWWKKNNAVSFRRLMLCKMQPL